MSDPNPVLVPLQLQAFVLNPAVCGTNQDDDLGARISPVTQPNYTFLRLDNFLLQNDVQNHVDLHSSAPASANSRLTDLGPYPPVERRHRHGVYVHWTLPRFYRSGHSTSDSVTKERQEQERLKRGLSTAESQTATGPGVETNTPEFVEPPTRWLVIRKIDRDSIKPASAQPQFKEYQAWVIESDHLWSLDTIPLDLDLQTDMAPFVVAAEGSSVDIEEQAEFFIGRKTPLEDWTGQEDLNATPPNISLLSSGNQLFADFQMHNTNVFSMLDDFKYGPKSNPQYLDGAKASYYLIGWHWNSGVDPLFRISQTSNHRGSFETLFMDLKGASDEYMDATDPLRLLCHGAMYDVQWDHQNKPADVPADRFAARLRDTRFPAISVGTTPMDALISYCTARKGSGQDPPSIAKLEEDILAIESLLHARDDGVDGQREAKDTIYNWNFTRSPGGTHYHFAGEDSTGKPVQPDDAAIKKLRALNQNVSLLDSCNRTMQQYRWDMFSTWWKFITDVSFKDDESGKNLYYQRQTKAISDRIQPLQVRIDDATDQVDQRLVDLADTVKSGTESFFFRNRDPTMLVGGIDSGWPSDYLEKIPVRLEDQLVISGTPLPQELLAIQASMTRSLPHEVANAAVQLTSEFYALRPEGPYKWDKTPPEHKVYPQFHDNNDNGRVRDQWGNRQPWFPLFAEWEAEYTHIPINKWKLDEQTARLSAHKLVRYGVTANPQKPLWEDLGPPSTHDTRRLSGRVLILPQPSFSLGAKVEQLFTNTPPNILDEYISQKDREQLLKDIGQLSYLSSPLAGFTDGLLTLAQGSHIKPENKLVADGRETISPIGAALFNNAGFTADNVGLIKGNSALTPYANMTKFTDKDHCPFKPAIHGQFKFIKFNIIDKFGQALAAIDPRPKPLSQGPPPLYPCISDFYEPQVVKINDKEYANTVIQDNEKQCEFIQLPPQINQNARLNASFVKRVADDPPERRLNNPDVAPWRPATEWENPIWGWIVTNYADLGVQVFLADGTFYREVRQGGPLGALPSPKWSPFKPSNTQPAADMAQLDALIDKLSDKDYLAGFWQMITTAQDNLPPAPSAYAQYLNSIVGKPLALVNMGWSLELDGPPFNIQSTAAAKTKPEMSLIESGPDLVYQFQVKLGDREVEYDGLVGYFDLAPAKDQRPRQELDLSKINTYFASDADGNTKEPLRPLTTENYPKFKAFWQPPFPTQAPYTQDQWIQPGPYEDRRNAKMSIFGAILDPFTPMHAYSSFLPSHTLQLPSWTWQEAMNTMTAFFHTGPLTVTSDVLSFDEDRRLTSQNWRDRPKANVSLPSLGAGEWNWLQPYVDPREEADLDAPPAYNAYGIESKGNILKPGFQEGPYTAIEGFLQLRNPIMMDKPEPEAA